MPVRQFNRVVDTAARASSPDPFARYPRLGQQILKSDFDIARPDFGLNLVFFLWRQLVVWSASALSEAAIVERKNVYAGRSKTFTKHIPQFALLVALV